MTQKPVMLLILDGWGYRQPVTPDNAIENGHTPNWHSYLKEYPHSLIETYGLAVGLPEGQMGNSEVGHMNLGAGRVVMQDLPRIDQAIKDGSIKENPVLKELIADLQKNGKTCHLMGLMSPGGVHSSMNHIVALCRILSENKVKVDVHAFLDGRDTPPSSAQEYLAEFEKDIAAFNGVKIATISGRFYAMDRDKRWDRVEAAYNAIALGEGKHAASADEAIAASYKDGVTDEFVVPCVIGDYKGFEEGDAVLMANFRADRAREILYALADREFTGFARKKEIRLSMAVGLTEYSVDHNRFMKTMFGPEALKNIFGEVVADHGLTQLRIAETEKYAHVTFFFNGGVEEPNKGEDRILVKSPKVATYDLQPEMSAPEVCDKLCAAIRSEKYDVIIINFANPDMVGHTGILDAAIKAVETVDTCVGKAVEALKEVDGQMFICADHGNAEQLVDYETGEPLTSHTTNPVPFILVNADPSYTLKEDGCLADIIPTMIELMGMEQPAEMTGKSLLIKK